MNFSEWGTRHSKKIFIGIVAIAAVVVTYLDYASHPYANHSASNGAKAGTSSHQKPSVDLLPCSTKIEMSSSAKVEMSCSLFLSAAVDAVRELLDLHARLRSRMAAVLFSLLSKCDAL